MDFEKGYSGRNKQDQGKNFQEFPDRENYKFKIQNHVNKDLSELKFFTNYIYHFLVGIIIFFLLFVDLLGAILFFMFALFRAIVSKRAQRHIIFTDLEIDIFEHQIISL